MRGTHILETAEEGQIKIEKESNRMGGTYQLETAEGEISQDTERKRLSEGHSLSEDRRGRGKSGHGKKVTK